mmetsp:Transcript_10311/g.32701  ORF Transcript_10311/g.32701 Transcript_10311/m.32701 type:complete len:224 (-) Transcript_10311:287-958(-)
MRNGVEAAAAACTGAAPDEGASTTASVAAPLGVAASSPSVDVTVRSSSVGVAASSSSVGVAVAAAEAAEKGVWYPARAFRAFRAFRSARARSTVGATSGNLSHVTTKTTSRGKPRMKHGSANLKLESSGRMPAMKPAMLGERRRARLKDAPRYANMRARCRGCALRLDRYAFPTGMLPFVRPSRKRFAAATHREGEKPNRQSSVREEAIPTRSSGRRPNRSDM